MSSQISNQPYYSQDNYCPTCGQSLPVSDSLRIHAPTRTLFRNGQAAILSEMMYRIFMAVSHARVVIGTKEIADIIYADHPDGGPAWPNECIRTTMYALRLRLRPLGITVVGHQKTGGYRIKTLCTDARSSAS